MTTLTQYEKVIREHAALYVYSTKLNTLGVFNDVKIVENTRFSREPLYYIRHYPGSNNHNEYIVSPDAGEVLNSGGTFKVWLTKADDKVGVKTLLDAIDIYAAKKIKKAFDTITEMRKKQDLAHETLDFMM